MAKSLKILVPALPSQKNKDEIRDEIRKVDIETQTEGQFHLARHVVNLFRIIIHANNVVAKVHHRVK